MSLVELLLIPAVDHAVASVAGLTDADLERSTPCPAWTVGAVLAHAIDSVECLTACLELRAEPPFGRETTQVDVHALSRGLVSAGHALIAAAVDAERRSGVIVDGLPLDVRHVVVVGAIEVAVHGWDAARGAGRAVPVPEELAACLLRELAPVVNPFTRPGLFADPVPLPPGPTSSDRLLAALGRDPHSSVGPTSGPRLPPWSAS